MSRVTNHQMYICKICKNSFPLRDVVQGTAIRDNIIKEINQEHPDWSANDFICRTDLNKYRSKYVHAMLESEKGELSSLEQEVLHSLRDHDVLSKNVDAEFEQEWSLGERLADRIASFGGS